MIEILTQLFQNIGKTIFFISISAFYILFLVLILKGKFYKSKGK